MLDNGNPLSIVPDFNFVVVRVDCYFDTTHGRVSHFVVGGVYQDFIEYLVQTRNVGYLSLLRRKISVKSKLTALTALTWTMDNR